MTIIYLPLEHIGMRYTSHLDRDISNHLTQSGIKHVKVSPDSEDRPISNGSFLDAPRTMMMKSRQLCAVAELYEEGLMKSGDVIWTSDLWFPGLESIPYLNYFCKKDVRIRGLLHAGSFTDTDFVRNMERWAKGFEDMLFDIIDRVYVGSQFMKDDVCKKRVIDPNRVEVTGFPLDTLEMDKVGNYDFTGRDPIVVFSGRNVDEKQPWLFDELKEAVSKRLGEDQVSFVNTHELNLSKQMYYELLGKAACVVSFALQENFGFAIHEAVYMGCVPVVPDRLCYPEFFDTQYRYKTFNQCVNKVVGAVRGELLAPPRKSFSLSIRRWFR